MRRLSTDARSAFITVPGKTADYKHNDGANKKDFSGIPTGMVNPVPQLHKWTDDFFHGDSSHKRKTSLKI
jgi:hypothetical protein